MNAGQLRLAVEGRKKYGSDYLYSVTSLGSPDRGRKKIEAKMIGLNPKAEVGAPSVSRSRTEVVANEAKAKTPGKGRQKVSWTRGRAIPSSQN